MLPYGVGGQPQQGQGSIATAVAAGLGVAVVGSALWGLISYATQHQFSLLAVVIGLCVGTVMTRVSRVRNPTLAIASAAIAVFGCALGSLVAEVLVFVRLGAPLGNVLSNPHIVFHYYPKAVGFLGFVFWAIAALYGYRVAMGLPTRRGYRMSSRRQRMMQQQQGQMQMPGQPGYGTYQPPSPGFGTYQPPSDQGQGPPAS